MSMYLLGVGTCIVVAATLCGVVLLGRLFEESA